MKHALAFLSLVAALIFAPSLATPAAAQPCQWNYTSPGNVSTATYCGNVNIQGTINTNIGPNVVPNIAAMQALVGYSSGATFTVQGYSSIGDGGGGTFVLFNSLCNNSGAGDGGTQFPGIPATTCWKRQFFSYMSPLWFGAKCDGITTDTSPIQKTLDAAGNYLIPVQINSMCNVNLITLHKGVTINGNGAASGFNMIGANAGFARDANISNLNFSNLSCIGDGVLADNQYCIIGNSSFGITGFTFTNIIANNITNALDLTGATDGVISGGIIGPTLGDGTVTGTGYCLAMGSPIAGLPVKANRVESVKFYHCARHSLYDSAGVAITSVNNQFIGHHFGHPYTGQLAGLVFSRGSVFSDTGSQFYDCYDAPFGFDNDEVFGTAATSFSLTGTTINNCPFPAFIGFSNTGSSTLDNIAVSINNINWLANPNSASTAPFPNALLIYGCRVCSISGNFDFADVGGLTTNVNVIVVKATQARGPFGLSINATARINTTGTTTGLVELEAGVAAAASTAEVFIAPSSNVIGAPLLNPDAEIQNSNIQAPGNTSVKQITGATPYASGFNNFNLTQSGATNVSNFLGGYAGQQIYVQCSDGNTTFQDNANLHTKARTNTACVNGTMYAFKSQGGTWFMQ